MKLWRQPLQSDVSTDWLRRCKSTLPAEAFSNPLGKGADSIGHIFVLCYKAEALPGAVGDFLQTGGSRPGPVPEPKSPPPEALPDPRDRTQGFCIVDRFFTVWAQRKPIKGQTGRNRVDSLYENLATWLFFEPLFSLFSCYFHYSENVSDTTLSVKLW